MSSAFFIDFLEPTSEFQMPVTFLLVDKKTKCGYSFSYLDRKENFDLSNCRFLIEFSRFILTTAPNVSVLPGSANNLSRLKL